MAFAIQLQKVQGDPLAFQRVHCELILMDYAQLRLMNQSKSKLQIKFSVILYFFMFSQSFASLCFVLLIALAFSKASKVNVACGTCQSKTGCPGNKCISFSGEITAEYCNDKVVCSFNAMSNIYIGKCSKTFEAGNCATGVCATGENIPMCYPLMCTYLDQVQFIQNCSGRSSTYTEWGGSIGSKPYAITLDMGMPCPVNYSTGKWNSCSGDSFGSSCSCCLSVNISGMPFATGMCVASDSPLMKVKALLKDHIDNYSSIMSMAFLFLMLLALDL